jgi:hypothetical protein
VSRAFTVGLVVPQFEFLGVLRGFSSRPLRLRSFDFRLEQEPLTAKVAKEKPRNTRRIQAEALSPYSIRRRDDRVACKMKNSNCAQSGARSE